MADIKRYPLVRHLRGTPTAHVVHLVRGAVKHEGVGLSFWFRPLQAVISEVPVADLELPLLFHARTSDFQDITVQATVTYRFVDPVLVATRIDFGIDPERGVWRSSPLEQVAQLLTELAQSHALDVLAVGPLEQALTTGVASVRDAVTAGLTGDQRLATTGIAVLGVRVLAIRPEADLERALQTPTREHVQSEADKATYSRRALAVERERAIAQNELDSKIQLAQREEQLVTQQGANARRLAEETAEAGRIETEARAARTGVLSTAEAHRTRLLGEAEAAAETAKLAAQGSVDQGVLLALALRELAGTLPAIGALTVTPDVLTGALARLVGRGDGEAAAGSGTASGAGSTTGAAGTGTAR